jgi:NADPH:quinone reductase-like Zn-dependent oxidoreductase
VRAAVTEEFGGIDRIVVRDLPKPTPGPGEVLVHVKAAATNPLDCKLREGQRVLMNGAAPGGTYVTTLPGAGPHLWRALTVLPLFGGRRCRALMLKIVVRP